jgi:hypothetical protein
LPTLGREIRRISVLEADLEKSKGDKENAVAEERMKARRARAVFWDLDLDGSGFAQREIPLSHWSNKATLAGKSWKEMVILLERLM